MNLQELRARTRPVTIEFDGETLNAEYRPSAFTPEMEDSFRDQDEAARPSGALVAGFCQLVVKWDLMDVPGTKGKPVPLEPAVIRTIPSRLLVLLFQKIAEDHTPNP